MKAIQKVGSMALAYVHPTASTGASISIPKFGSFSVSCGGGYDERGNQKTFNY